MGGLAFDAGRRSSVADLTVLRISRLAEYSGVPATTPRFYESEGLLPAGRTPSGYRVQGDGAVARLEFIGAAEQLGLSLDEIGELLAVWESGACAEVTAGLWPRLAARQAEAGRQLAELTAYADLLRIARDRLAALPDRAEPCGSACGPRAAVRGLAILTELFGRTGMSGNFAACSGS